MNVAALVLWIMTALGGITMASIWLANRGPAQYSEGRSRLSPARVGGHFALAALGLVLWIIYTSGDNAAVGWIALLILPIAAYVGYTMVTRWRSARVSGRATTGTAEQKIPAAVVTVHGLFAVVTILAVLVALFIR